MNIFNKKYKYIIASLFIFIFEINNFATSQSMDESRRAMQQSKDIMSLSAENKMCQNSCSSSFRSDALNNPSNANRIFDRCLSGCQENYQSKMSCIQSQLSSQYSPSNCNRSQSSSNLNINGINGNNFSSNFIWFIIFCFVGLFLLKRKEPKRFQLIYLYLVESKEKLIFAVQKKENLEIFSPRLLINILNNNKRRDDKKNIKLILLDKMGNISSILYFCLAKIINSIKNLMMFIKNLAKVIKIIFFGSLLMLASSSLIYLILNDSFGPNKKEEVINYLLKPEFDFINPFNNGRSLVGNKDAQYFIDNQGKKIFNNHYSYSSGFFSEDLMAVAFKDGFSNDWGYIDTAGKIAITPIFSQAENFSEGLAAVLISENGKWGFINKKGVMVIQPNYDYASSFSNGMAVVTVNESGEDKKGYIDTNGKLLIPIKYSQAYGFDENLAPVFNVEMKKWGFIDKRGELVIDYKFDSTFGFSEGLAAVEIDKKWGYINAKGDIQIKPSFIYINYFKPSQDTYAFQEGLSAVWIGNEENGKIGFINKKGEIIIKPIYDEAKNFSQGLAAVRIGDEASGKWGFINKKGEFIIKPTFDGVSSFNEGFSSVGIDGKYALNGKFEAATVIKQSKFGIIRHPFNNIK